MNNKSKSKSLGVNREVGLRPNQQQVQEPTAGRELDALVAEKVMGEAYPEPISAYPWWSSAPVLSPGKQWVASVHPEGSDPARHIWVPRYYSTDIAAAWQVVERVGDMNVHRFYDPTVSVWLYHVAWSSGDGVMHHVSEESESAPLAICLAALRAMDAPSAVDRSRFSPKKEVAL